MCIKVVAGVLLGASASVSIFGAAAAEEAISKQSITEQMHDVEELVAQSARIVDGSASLSIADAAEKPAAGVEAVEVTAERLPGPVSTPAIPQGLLAILWAVVWPTQAWKILVPLAPEHAAELNRQPDATDPYRPASLPPH